MFIDIYLCVDIEMGYWEEQQRQWREQSGAETQMERARSVQTLLTRNKLSWHAPELSNHFRWWKQTIKSYCPSDRSSGWVIQAKETIRFVKIVSMWRLEMINYFYYRWAETACAQIRREFTATVQSVQVQSTGPLSCAFVFSTLVLYCPIFIISTSS